MPDWHAIAPRVVVSYTTSWDQFVAVIHQLFSTAETVDESVKTVVTELTARCRTLQGKIAVINQFMRTKVDYLPISHLKPLPAPITLAYEEGGCKDQAALMIAMLKAVHIPAYPVIINPYLGGDLDFSFPNGSVPELHVIVAVPHESGWWFFDPSAYESYDPNYLPLANRNKRGNLAVNTVAKLTGEEAMLYRYPGSVVNFNQQIVAMYKHRIAAVSPRGAKITSFTLTDSLSSSPLYDPFTISFDFTETGFVQTSSKTQWFTVPYLPPFGNPAQVLSYLGESDRRYSYIARKDGVQGNSQSTRFVHRSASDGGERNEHSGQRVRSLHDGQYRQDRSRSSVGNR